MVALAGISKLHDNPFPGMQPTWSTESYVSAVSIAFGKGFHSIQPGSAPEVDAFVAGKRASLEASSLEGAVFGPVGVDEGRHFYLEYFVGLSWRLLGVGWRTLLIPVVAMYVLLALLVYVLLRQAGGVVFSLGGAAAFIFSSSVCDMMPHLRDFGRAVFIVASIAVLIRLMAKPARAGSWLGWAALLGGIFGVGFGFREDSIVGLPLAAMVLGGLAPLEGRFQWMRRGAALSVMAVIFVAAAYPASSHRGGAGHTMMHYFALGFVSDCHEQMGYGRCAYDWITSGDDSYVTDTLDRERRRFSGPFQPPSGMSTQDETAGGVLYFTRMVESFPADMIARALSFMVYCLRRDTGLPGPLDSWGVVLALGAFFIAVARAPRRAVAGVLFVLYFLALSCIQYSTRHLFYLALIPLFCGVYLGTFLIERCRARWASHRGEAVTPAAPARMARGGKALLVLTAVAVALTAAVYEGAAWYQARQCAAMLRLYEDARLRELPYERIEDGDTVHFLLGKGLPNALMDGTSDWDYLAVDLVLPERELFLRLQYSAEVCASGYYSNIVRAERGTDGDPHVRLFFPIYQHSETAEWIRFEGLSLLAGDAGAFQKAYRVENHRDFPFLLVMSLPAHANDARMSKPPVWRANTTLRLPPPSLRERNIGWPPGVAPATHIPQEPSGIISCCEKLVAERPYAFGPLMALGAACETAGALERARDTYLAAAKLAPEFPVPLTRLDRVHARLPVSSDTWKGLAEANPTALPPSYWYGVRLMEEGDTERAADLFTRALDTHPSSLTAVRALVEAFVAEYESFPEIQRIETEVTARAERETPALRALFARAFAPAYIAQARERLADGAWDDAFALAEEALRRLPGDEEAARIRDTALHPETTPGIENEVLAQLLRNRIEEGRLEDARALLGDFAKHVTMNPKTLAETLTGWAAAYRQHDRKRESLLCWMAAVAVIPHDFDTVKAADTAFGGMLGPEEALDTWRALYTLVPVHEQICFFQGIALMKAKRFEEADDAFAESYFDAPGSAYARGLFGATRLRLGDCASAVALLAGALRDAPGADNLRAPFVEALLCAGREEEARAQARFCAEAGIELPAPLRERLP